MYASTWPPRSHEFSLLYYILVPNIVTCWTILIISIIDFMCMCKFQSFSYFVHVLWTVASLWEFCSIPIPHYHAKLKISSRTFIVHWNTGNGHKPLLNISNTVTLPPVFHWSVRRSARKDLRGYRMAERNSDEIQGSQRIPHPKSNQRLRIHL